MTPNHDYSRIIVPKDSPLWGTAPDEIRTLLQQDYSEKLLAAAMAAVSNHTGYIHHDINDPNNDEAAHKIIEAQFDIWWKLERELVIRISNILICENPEKGILENTGYHYIIQPFMERNGYRDCGGWWIKEAVVVDEFHFDKYTILALDQDIPTKKHDTYVIGGVAYKAEYLHIRPATNEPIRNHIAIKASGSYLGKTVRFEIHESRDVAQTDQLLSR